MVLAQLRAVVVEDADARGERRRSVLETHGERRAVGGAHAVPVGVVLVEHRGGARRAESERGRREGVVVRLEHVGGVRPGDGELVVAAVAAEAEHLDVLVLVRLERELEIEVRARGDLVAFADACLASVEEDDLRREGHRAVVQGEAGPVARPGIAVEAEEIPIDDAGDRAADGAAERQEHGGRERVVRLVFARPDAGGGARRGTDAGQELDLLVERTRGRVGRGDRDERRLLRAGLGIAARRGGRDAVEADRDALGERAAATELLGVDRAGLEDETAGAEARGRAARVLAEAVHASALERARGLVLHRGEARLDALRSVADRAFARPERTREPPEGEIGRREDEEERYRKASNASLHAALGPHHEPSR